MSIINSVRRSGLYQKLIQLVPKSWTPAIREAQYNLATLMEYGRRDMFTSVSIETDSRCNRLCPYCPNSDPALKSQRPQKPMDMDLYKRIIDGLAEIRYKGKVALQHYGEPLLDPHLEGRIRLTREKLPEAEIVTNTNGDFLTPEKFEALIAAGINGIYVTNHNADGHLSPALSQLESYLDRHPEKRKYYHIRTGVAHPTDRGGLVDVGENRRRVEFCINESHTLTIDVEGRVVLCSNDYLGQVVLGELSKQGIMEVWDSPRFKKLRKEKKKGIFTEGICKACSS